MNPSQISKIRMQWSLFYCSLTLKALGYLLPVQHEGGCFPLPLCNIRSRHPRKLKLLWVDSLYYVLENMVIESPTITDDIIITSLPKTMAKIHFLLNWSHRVKSYGHFCQILALLTILAHQIWSCHITQDAHLKIFYFVLILHLISGKVTKFLV